MSRGEKLVFVFFQPVQDFQTAIPMLDQGGTAFYPIAVIAVDDPGNFTLFGVVDVSTDHSVNLLFAGFIGHGLFVIIYVLNSVLNFVL